MKTQTKIKRNFKKHPIQFSLQCILALIGAQLLLVGSTWVWQLTQIQPVLAEINYTAEKPEAMTDKEYVLDQVRRNGLNPDEVDCIITHESGWNKNAVHVNNNGSVDLGIFQINFPTHSKTITPAQAFDVVQATRFAIMKRLADGNWNAWYGSKSCK